MSYNMQNISQYLLENDEMLALIYACDEQSLPIFRQTQVMQEFFTHFFNTTPHITDLEHIKEYMTPQLNQNLYSKLVAHFSTLCNAQIISKAYFHTLLLTIYAHKAKPTTTNTESTQHKDLTHIHALLKEFYPLLQDLCVQDSQKKALQKALENATNQKFSIGVTGVLSAGKSTFLNALLGQEILGSSTIPETANLTILQYAQEQYAKVYFWNTQEWEDMLTDSEFDTGLQHFVQQTQNIFKDDLASYITHEGVSKCISLEDLSTYTSANHPSKMCNLIKKVELFTPLKFLQGGVDIVDTPGLDDPITKREEITKDYIKDCDLLIHLMNASCAATQVDVDFILETLIERNISRLLVVLTRADLISQKELEQSLEYTKQSLQNAILKISQTLDSHNILSRITFLPISSYNALKVRTQPSSLGQTEMLTQSGILAIEEYLDNVLLGDNSLKAKDIAYICLKSFSAIAQDIAHDLHLESKILHTSKEELQSFIAQEQTHNTHLKQQAQHITQAIEDKKKELTNTLNILNDFITMSLQTSQDRLKERVLQNILYAKKQNRHISKENLEELFSVALKDIFTDISRDYKYKLNTKITHIIQDIHTLYPIAIHTHTPPTFNFHTKDEQVAHFVHILSAEIFSHIHSNALSSKLDSIFSHTFNLFSQLIIHKSKHTQEGLLAFFYTITTSIEQEFQAQIHHKEQALQKALQQFEQNNNEETKRLITQKLDSITQLQKRISEACKELE